MRRLRMVTVGGGAIALALIVGALLLAPASHPAIVQADQSNDPNLLELAQRYFARDGGTQVDFLPGVVPGDLPLTAAIPPGGRLIGTIARHTSARSTTWDILFDLASPPTEITAFYERTMQSTGWSTPAPFSYDDTFIPSGFQAQHISVTPTRTPVPRTPTANATARIMLCRQFGSADLSVTARPMANGVTGVTNEVDSIGSQCAAFARRSTPTPAPPPPALPALNGPPDVAIESYVYHDQPNTVSDALATTDISSAELEAYIANELTAAGWSRITGEARDALAWSLWSTPNGDQAYLSVLSIAGTRERNLHIQIGPIAGADSRFSDPAQPAG